MSIPTREERRRFLAERQTGVRSSDVPSLLGLWGNPLEVYYAKTRPLAFADEELAPNLNLLRGVMYEDDVVELYVRHCDLVDRRVAVREIGHDSKPDPECPILGTHVDRMVLDIDSGAEWPLEAKAPSLGVYRRLAERGFSISYFVQIQVHIACWEAEYGEYVAANLEPHGLPVPAICSVDRDEKMIGVIRKVAEHFWNEHVEPRRPPAVDQYSKYLAQIDEPEPTPEGELVVGERLREVETMGRSPDGTRPRAYKSWVDRRVRRWAQRFWDARAQKERAIEIEKEAASRLQRAMALTGVETLRAPGIGWWHWKPQKGGLGAIDVELLDGHRPIDRDALVRLIGEKIPPSQMEAGVVASRILNALDSGELDLDVNNFRKPRAGSRPFKPYQESPPETEEE